MGVRLPSVPTMSGSEGAEETSVPAESTGVHSSLNLTEGALAFPSLLTLPGLPLYSTTSKKWGEN